jgi:hypothetical protein
MSFMTAKTHSTTAPRVVYQSPCARVKVMRDGPKDFSLYLDGVYSRSFERSWDAEHEGGMWLHEQAEALALQLRDEEAERDAEQADDPILVAARWLDAHQPSELPADALAAVAANLADPAHRNRAPIEIDRTVNGISIMGEFDTDGAPYGVAIETDHWMLNADADGHLTLCCDADGALIELDVSKGAIAVLRDVAHLVAGDTPERLLARARQWDGLRPPEPELPPPAPIALVAAPTPVCVIDRTSFHARAGTQMAKLYAALVDEMERREAEPILTWLESLTADELAAQLQYLYASLPPTPAICVERADDYISFACERVSVVFQDSPPINDVNACGMAGLDLADVVRDLPALVTLLNDPRVKQAVVRAEAGAPQKRAA